MNIRSFLTFIVAAAIPCMPVFSDDAVFQGPVLGYYVDPDVHGLHVLGGLPGSATLGPALTTGLDAVWVAPDGRTALGLRGGVIFLVRDIRDTSTLLPLTSWTGTIDEVGWSADSSGVVVYSAARRVLQSATGLPGNPVVNPEIDIANLGGSLSSLRLGAKPWTAALVVKGRGTGLSRPAPSMRPAPGVGRSLFLAPASGSVVPVPGISSPGAMDFSADSKSLYVVDGGSNQLMKVSVSAPDAATVVTLRSPGLIPADFTDLAILPDGQRMLALQQDHRQACGVDLGSGNTTFCADLDFTATALRHLSGSLYMLDSLNDRITPLWLLDSGPGNTFFVPRGGQR